MYISYFVILNQILICSTIFAVILLPPALIYYMIPHHEICKHFSIFAPLFENRSHGYFFNFLPTAD